jgi:hypothetical protein
MPIAVKAFIVVLLVLPDAVSSYLLNVEVREPVAIRGEVQSRRVSDLLLRVLSV